MTELRADHINNFPDESKAHFTYEQDKKFQLEVDNYYGTRHDSLLKSISNFKNSIILYRYYETHFQQENYEIIVCTVKKNGINFDNSTLLCQ